ncbi:revertant of glycogen synthase kinase mutation [Plectosphaerella plurivora]|uniref:Revertant of glycogen synthase kinase mutation n=1 Tax=Plectosphaerella plurivora TaxID=936078 RepID=A0A9P8V7E7_9PEZI|nr:revertant of glycogen synthase kinase mutation [Plectosphaerella plurivora]
MQLIHQIGQVKIGEVVRYTVTYTPSQDRILPSPEKLYLRIRNTSAIALRAAFVHGPYNLCVAAYPASYNPNRKFNNPRRYGVPEFEPMVKAGGSWQCELVVPEHIRQSAGIGGGGQHFGGAPSDPAGAADGEVLSASWIVEVSSQVIFSTSAAVGYEIVLARDEKSLSLSSALPVIGGQAQVPQPGKVSDHQHEPGYREPAGGPLSKGVFSRAIRLKVEDTATLWNTPRLPGWEYGLKQSGTASESKMEKVRLATPKAEEHKSETRKQKKVHLVVLTHGLHSNLGADMLYLKESIDATVRQAKVDAKKRKAQERADRKAKEAAATTAAAEPSVPEGDGPGDGEVPSPTNGSSHIPAAADESIESDQSDDEDDEEVIVRGFSGNATRTERGIKFLGKRLARYVLSTCYPDQPYLPSIKGAAAEGLAAAAKHHEGKPVHKNSSIHKDDVETQRPFKITSISFVGHSLGGLVQTYAVAYIQKHSPEFFELIKPINFVAMATPFLGLSNENPLYVKFALDFGLVGRTGQDLGLTWRAPTIARSGWGAIVSNLGESAHKRVVGESRPESKPLLRILPTGPAHTALKKFRNRTTYSNVVNDGIVPLRTSCLLFLDWQGLGRVEKARRDAGLVETLVGAGWAELTGANVTGARRDQRQLPPEEDEDDENHDGDDESGTATPKPTNPENAAEVPQPSQDAIIDDDKVSLRSVGTPYAENGSSAQPSTPNTGPFAGFFNLFKSNEPHPPQPPAQLSPKQNKIYRRSQTIKFDEDAATASSSSVGSKVTTGQEFENEVDGLNAPPRTTFFESAHDLINPTLPSTDFILDPSKRPRAIFHDRVYHPSDIPPPPLKKKSTGSASSTLSLRRRNTNASTKTTDTNASSNTEIKDHASDVSSPFPSQDVDRQDSTLSARDYDDTPHTNPGKAPDEEVDGSQMRVEEKIARAYHRGIAWRKVLVKVEPDAHNNIIVRRMFANAFGWPVVKHMVDAHFSDAATARTRVDDEGAEERALDVGQPPDQYGGEVKLKKGDKRSTSGKETVAQRGAREEQAEQKKDATNGLRVDTGRSDSLTREAEDKVSDLPHVDSSPVRTGSSGNGSSPPRLRSTPRQQVFRADSMTWSDGDWIDTDDDDHSDNGTKSPRVPSSPSQAGFPSSAMLSPSSAAGPSNSGSNWNWTEKIVGRSSSKRASAREGSGLSSISTTSSAGRGETQQQQGQPQTPTTPTLTIDRPRNDSLGVD